LRRAQRGETARSPRTTDARRTSWSGPRFTTALRGPSIPPARPRGPRDDGLELREWARRARRGRQRRSHSTKQPRKSGESRIVLRPQPGDVAAPARGTRDSGATCVRRSDPDGTRAHAPVAAASGCRETGDRAGAPNAGSGRDPRAAPRSPLTRAHAPPATCGSNGASGRDAHGEAGEALHSPVSTRTRLAPTANPAPWSGPRFRRGRPRARRARKRDAPGADRSRRHARPRDRSEERLESAQPTCSNPRAASQRISRASARFPTPTAGSRSVRNTGNTSPSQQSAATCLRRP